MRCIALSQAVHEVALGRDPRGQAEDMIRRRMIWNLTAAILFLVLAVTLPVPVWGRAVLGVAALLELCLAAFARSVLTSHQNSL
jgi:hypothetical protein